MLGGLLLVSVAPVLGQEPKSPPRQTTATFGDWILRCVSLPGEASMRSCEIYQQVQAVNGGQASVLMTFAIGAPGAGEPLQITAAIPVNVGFSGKVMLSGDAIPPTELRFVRCGMGACFAASPFSEALWRTLSSKAGSAARVEYTNAAEAPVVVPISMKGIGDALEALSTNLKK